MQSDNSTLKHLEEFLTNNIGSDDSCFQLTAGNCAFRVDFDRIESLGCTITKITCALHNPSHRTADQLVELSEKLAAKLNYLVEPIQVIEVDRADKAIQLRSSPPEQNENVRCYFELHLNQDGIRLFRYEKQPRSSRKKIPCVLTQKVLLRLASDLLAAIDAMES